MQQHHLQQQQQQLLPAPQQQQQLQQQQQQQQQLATTPVAGALSPAQTPTGPSAQQQQQHLTSPHHQQLPQQQQTPNSVASGASANLQQNAAVAPGQTQIVAPTTASVSPSSVSSQKEGEVPENISVKQDIQLYGRYASLGPSIIPGSTKPNPYWILEENIFSRKNHYEIIYTPEKI